MMKLSALISCDRIVPDLQSDTKREAIRELVQALVAAGGIPARQSGGVLRSLLKREELGSTGIGKGMGVPHARHGSVKRPLAAFGRSAEGIEFDSIDGQKVHLLFLLVSPPDAGDEHVKALTRISMLVKDEDMGRFLRQAKGAEEIAQLFAEADDRLGR